MPNIVTNLTAVDSELEEEAFQTIMKFMMDLMTKDKQHELLVEKLCQYFESASTDRQFKDLAFCLSLMNFSEKALRKVKQKISL